MVNRLPVRILISLLIVVVPAAVAWVLPSRLVVAVLVAGWVLTSFLWVFTAMVDTFVWGTWNKRKPWPTVHLTRWKRDDTHVILWSLPFVRKIHAWSWR